MAIPEARTPILYRICNSLLVAIALLGMSGCSMRPDLGKANKPFLAKGLTLKHHQVQVGAQPLHLAWVGDSTKPAVVFVHGSPGNWEDYAGLMQDSLLLQHFCIAAVDRPGFGSSGYGICVDSLGLQASYMNALLQSWSHKGPKVLVGHSYGGPLVVKMAMDQPEAYQSLVLLAAAVDPELEEKEWFRPVVRGIGFMLPDALEVSNDELAALKVHLEYMKPEWQKLKLPIIMVHGTKDMLVPYANVAFAANRLTHNPAFKVVTITGANHFLPWSHVDEVRKAILEAGGRLK